MTPEERKEIISSWCPWDVRELTPQWFLTDAPLGAHLLHICRPGTWTRLEKAFKTGEHERDLLNGVVFSRWKKGECKECKEQLPKYLHTLCKLIILGKAIRGY